MADILTKMKHEIDTRASYVSNQVSLGQGVDDVLADQFRGLLQHFSQQRVVTIEVINGVVEHMKTKSVFTNDMILACSSCLKNLERIRLDHPTNRHMQVMIAAEHYLLQCDWDKLDELARQSPTLGTDPMAEVLAV